MVKRIEAPEGVRVCNGVHVQVSFLAPGASNHNDHLQEKLCT